VALLLARLCTGTDPAIDQGLLVATAGRVDPETRAVFGLEAELVVAGLVGDERAFPSDGEFLRVDLFVSGLDSSKLNSTRWSTRSKTFLSFRKFREL
jgi:hypothetical protein